jgi:hypothetical protein
MNGKGINLGPLIESGAEVGDCVDALIAATDFDRLIASAICGDRAAAKELLTLAAAYLGNDEFGPMPPELRRYLRKAFVEVAIGKSADAALNLKKTGRPRRHHRDELRIGQWIRKRMAVGETLDKAASDLAEYIAAGLRKHETFYGFSLIPDSKTLEGIYADVLPKLCNMEKFVTP